MTTEAQKRATKKADAQSIMFAVKYRKNEIQEGQRLKDYLEITGQSANAYLKVIR